MWCKAATIRNKGEHGVKSVLIVEDSATTRALIRAVID